jgi:hypothetical protein
VLCQRDAMEHQGTVGGGQVHGHAPAALRLPLGKPVPLRVPAARRTALPWAQVPPEGGGPA